MLLTYIMISINCLTNKDVCEKFIESAKKTNLWNVNLDIAKTRSIKKKLKEFLRKNAVAQSTIEKFIRTYRKPFDAKQILEDFEMFLEFGIYAESVCKLDVMKKLLGIKIELDQFILLERETFTSVGIDFDIPQLIKFFALDFENIRLKVKNLLSKKLELLEKLNKQFIEIISPIKTPLKKFTVNDHCREKCEFEKIIYSPKTLQIYDFTKRLLTHAEDIEKCGIKDCERLAQRFKTYKLKIQKLFLDLPKACNIYLLSIDCVAEAFFNILLQAQNDFETHYKNEMQRLSQKIAKNEDKLLKFYMEKLGDIFSKWSATCFPLLNESKKLYEEHFKNESFEKAIKEIESKQPLSVIDAEFYLKIMDAKHALIKIRENIKNVVTETSSAIDEAGNLPAFSRQLFRTRMHNLCLRKVMEEYSIKWIKTINFHLFASKFENEDKYIERLLAEYNTQIKEQKFINSAFTIFSVVAGVMSVVYYGIYYYF